LYLSTRKYDKAIEDYTKSIELSPTNADAYYGRGRAYYYKMDQEKATADFNKAIELDPAFADLLKSIGLDEVSDIAEP